MPKERGRKVVATNRKARHDYHIEDVFEAGLVLTGTEVKSLRAGPGVAGRRVRQHQRRRGVAGGRAHPGVHRRAPGPTTSRGASASCCCTATRSTRLAARDPRAAAYTLVPLSLYFKDGRAKVEIAVARGKRDYDKRQALRERQDSREADRAMAQARGPLTPAGPYPGAVSHPLGSLGSPP